MKNQYLLFLMLFPFFAKGQATNFTITSKIGNLNKPAKIYFDYPKNGVDVSDSAYVTNGVFKFSGYTPDIAGVRLALAHQDEGLRDAILKAGEVLYFYIGKENVSITSSGKLSDGQITGSKINDEFIAYNKSIGGTMMDLTNAANADWNSLTESQLKDTTYTNAVGARFHKSIEKRAQNQLQFARNNPDSFFALVGLSEAMENKDNLENAQLIFTGLSEKIRNTDMGKQLGSEMAMRINAISITAVGKPAPLFTQADSSGKPVSLADLKGKVVLVDFWASWCHPCRGENPNLVKQYQLYKDKGFQIISVSLDNNKKNWLAAIAYDGLTWLQVSDLKGWNNEVGRLYGVRSVPACFLVGKDGNIIANDLRGETLNAKLAEIFKD